MTFKLIHRGSSINARRLQLQHFGFEIGNRGGGHNITIFIRLQRLPVVWGKHTIM